LYSDFESTVILPVDNRTLCLSITATLSKEIGKKDRKGELLAKEGDNTNPSPIIEKRFLNDAQPPQAKAEYYPMHQVSQVCLIKRTGGQGKLHTN